MHGGEGFVGARNSGDGQNGEIRGKSFRLYGEGEGGEMLLTHCTVLHCILYIV